MKYKKKPVIIEAVKFICGSEVPVMNFLGLTEKYRKDVQRMYYENDVAKIEIFQPEVSSLFIKTLEGELKASNGDYIIKGVNGEFYPCKPDIFEKTYEPCDKDNLDRFKESVTPLMNYLKENYHPHCTAIVTSKHAEITEGIKSFVDNEY